METDTQRTILLVEDEAAIALAEIEMIRGFGYRVLTAHSGEKAVDLSVGAEKTGTDKIDLILMDIDLGRGIDGTEAARRILSEREIPIVFLTSHSGKEYVDRVREITRYGYVIKNSGEFVLRSSIEMAFELFEAHASTRESEERYRLLAHHMQQGLAIHEVVCDAAGTVVDYRFLDLNPFFESITGLRRDRLIGRTVREVLPDTEPFWIEQYGRVAQTGEPLRFEHYSQELKRHYQVSAYRLKPGQFVTVATDVTEQQKERSIMQLLSSVSEVFLRATSETIDYQFITDTVRILSGAEYAAFNLFESDGRDFTTVAISGLHDRIRRAVAMLGFELPGKNWKHDPARAARTADSIVTRFSHLNELTGIVLPGSVVRLIERSFGLGETVVAKVLKDDLVIGDFTLFMPAGTDFSRSELVEVYCREVGLLLTRLRAEARVASLLGEKELLLHEVHHRIKNNMTTMASLLSLQSSMMKDEAASSALKDAERRLKSMEVLYDRLYRSENVKEMSIRDYLPPLIGDIIQSFPRHDGIEVGMRIDDFTLDAKTLSVIGIILNELITNSLKHAFGGRDSGTITVSASRHDGTVRMTLEDDGSGIPRSVETGNSGGFGLHLVEMLMEQIEGTVRLERGEGTKIVMEFPAGSGTLPG